MWTGKRKDLLRRVRFLMCVTSPRTGAFNDRSLGMCAQREGLFVQAGFPAADMGHEDLSAWERVLVESWGDHAHIETGSAFVRLLAGDQQVETRRRQTQHLPPPPSPAAEDTRGVLVRNFRLLRGAGSPQATVEIGRGNVVVRRGPLRADSPAFPLPYREPPRLHRVVVPAEGLVEVLRHIPPRRVACGAGVLLSITEDGLHVIGDEAHAFISKIGGTFQPL